MWKEVILFTTVSLCFIVYLHLFEKVIHNNQASGLEECEGGMGKHKDYIVETLMCLEGVSLVLVRCNLLKSF